MEEGLLLAGVVFLFILEVVLSQLVVMVVMEVEVVLTHRSVHSTLWEMYPVQ